MPTQECTRNSSTTTTTSETTTTTTTSSETISSENLGDEDDSGEQEEDIPPPDTISTNIFSLAQSIPTLSKFVAIVIAADWMEILSSPQGPFTVFAPTNDAFLALSMVDDLQISAMVHSANNGDKGPLADMLKYHIVSGKFLSTQLGPSQLCTTPLPSSCSLQVATLQGKLHKLSIEKNLGAVTVSGGLNGAVNVVKGDIEATNGVIDIIDGVLIPRSFCDIVGRTPVPGCNVGADGLL